MKKLMVLFSIALFFIGCGKSEGPVKAEVSFVMGKAVKVFNDTRTDVVQGMIIEEGAMVETEDQSHVKITMGENQIEIGEESVLHLTTHSTDGTVLFSLEKGRMDSKVNKLVKGSSYEVKTPTAIAAVRGTDFTVQEGDCATFISCREGSVLVTLRESGETRELKAGDMMKFSRSKVEHSVEPLKEEAADSQSAAEISGDKSSKVNTSKTEKASAPRTVTYPQPSTARVEPAGSSSERAGDIDDGVQKPDVSTPKMK